MLFEGYRKDYIEQVEDDLMLFRDIFVRRHRQDDERFLNRFSQRLSDEATLKVLLTTMKGDVAEVLRVAHQNQGMFYFFLFDSVR